MPDSINERIRKYRIAKKIKQSELGEKLGLKCSTYSQMERKGTISVEMALKIADILEIDPALIIYGNETGDRLEFTPIKPQKVVANAPRTAIEELYGEPKKKEHDGEFPFKLSNTEKNIISVYHNLSKSKQKQIREFIDEIRKG